MDSSPGGNEKALPGAGGEIDSGLTGNQDLDPEHAEEFTGTVGYEEYAPHESEQVNESDYYGYKQPAHTQELDLRTQGEYYEGEHMVQYGAEGLGTDFHKGDELVSYNEGEGLEESDNLYRSEVTGLQLRGSYISQ